MDKEKSHGGTRPGAGRPKVGKRRWSFRLSEEEYQRLLLNAKESGMTAAEYVRRKCCGA